MRIFLLWIHIFLFSNTTVFCQSMISIGLMSGTSMDGIDAALIRTDGQQQVVEISHTSMDYPKEFHYLLKGAEYVVRTSKGDMVKALQSDFIQGFKTYLKEEMHLPATKVEDILRDAITYLHKDKISLQDVIDHSTHLHALVVKKLIQESSYSAQEIDVIGYHGQTLYHAPAQGISIQVGDAQKLTNSLGIQVVTHFRQNDLQNGGQGAPFAPLYHRALGLRDNLLPMAVINCGGIANITLILTPDINDLTAYDTGPGNGLIDAFVKRKTQFKETMDKDGKYGLQGLVNQHALKQLFEKSVQVGGKNYFHIKPPKSLDIHDMKLIPELDTLSLNDGCTTLEAFTAYTITRAIPKSLENFHVILAGGGWHNPVLRMELETALKQTTYKIYTADEIGWNNKALEAQIFAYLAVRSLKGHPLSLPKTTNVKKPVTGGVVYRPDPQIKILTK